MERNNKDEIVDEVRAARQVYAARFGFDIRRIVEDLKAKESKHPERRADLQPCLAPLRDPENLHDV